MFDKIVQMDVLGRYMPDTEKQVYISTAYGANKYVLSNYYNTKGLKYYTENLAIRRTGSPISDEDMSWIISEVDDAIANGQSVQLGIYDDKSHEIRLESTNPNVYSSDSTLRYNGEGHAIFITGRNDYGFYISSYGQQYIIPFSDLQNGGIFTIFAEGIWK